MQDILRQEKIKADMMRRDVSHPEDSYWLGYRMGLTADRPANEHAALLDSIGSPDQGRDARGRGYRDGIAFRRNHAYRPGYVTGKTKVGFYLPDPLVKQLKVHAAETGDNQSEVVERAVKRLLGEDNMTDRLFYEPDRKETGYPEHTPDQKPITYWLEDDDHDHAYCGMCAANAVDHEGLDYQSMQVDSKQVCVNCGTRL